jgi:hypothetical protein
MDQRTNKIIRKYLTAVALMNKNFFSAYLFGSYPTQTERTDSDIEIL